MTGLLFASGSLLAFGGGGAIAWHRINRYPRRGSQYASWLLRSPWQASNGLPFGPWHPVWLDIPVLLGFGVLATAHFALASVADRLGAIVSTRCLVGMAIPFLSFAITWVVLGVTQFAQYAWVFAYGFTLWLGCLVHASITSEAFGFAFVVVSFCVAFVGLWRWLVVELRGIPLGYACETPLLEQQKHCRSGSYFPLSPKSEPLMKSFFDRCNVRSAALGAVWFFVWSAAFVRVSGANADGFYFVVMIALILGLARLVAYTVLHSSPLGVTARWKARRLIVPAYDRVYLPSMAMVGAASLAAWLCPAMSIPSVVSVPTSLAVLVLMMLLSGPGEDWFLTAPSHIRLLKPTKKQQLTFTGIKSES